MIETSRVLQECKFNVIMTLWADNMPSNSDLDAHYQALGIQNTVDFVVAYVGYLVREQAREEAE